MDDYPQFIAKKALLMPEKGVITCTSPSNIALVKYWGKKPIQLPGNPSISFTLDKCNTKTTLHFEKRKSIAEDFDFQLIFQGILKPDFKPKVTVFFERIFSYVPFLKQYKFRIETSNTFPHSSGIASSASGMSALAYCIVELERKMIPVMTQEYCLQKASFLSRLGSGSASRSIEGPIMVWGSHKDLEGSNDGYAIVFPYTIHPNFCNYQDTILLVDTGEKQVSSSVGHDLMHGHPFSSERFDQANTNITSLKDILISGDLDAFIEIVESEALTLHAMMMSSIPYFILMKPNTLSIIQRVWQYRIESGSKVCFTLDAGANVHLLYPYSEQSQVIDFIKRDLVVYCQKGQYICDTIGLGAKLL